MATKTRAELKNEAESKAQALRIVKTATAHKSKVVADAAQTVQAAIDAGTLSEAAILSLSSGTWDENHHFKNGKWDMFSHYTGFVEREAKQNALESPAFNSLISALTAQFEADGLKGVSVLMHTITSHLAVMALSHSTNTNTHQLFDYNMAGWERSAKAAQKKRQRDTEHALGAAEVDALLNPKAKKPAKKAA